VCRADSEPADFYRIERPVARVEHTCGECERTILVGEPYERHSFGSERTAETHVVCTHCSVLALWLLHNCDGAIAGEVIEDIEEHGRDYKRDDLLKLVAFAGNRWRKPWSQEHTYPGVPIPQLPPPLQADAMPSLTVHVDASDVLEELSDEELQGEVGRRAKQKAPPGSSEAQDRHLLEQVWQTFRGRGDAPPCLREYVWRVLGKVL
jgi:hypothetical protein